MKSSSLLGHSAELLRIIRKSPQPADLLTSSYMRDRKYIGASDRRGISALVFHAQRVADSALALWSAALSSMESTLAPSHHRDDSSHNINSDELALLRNLPPEAACIAAAVALAPMWDCSSSLTSLTSSTSITAAPSDAPASGTSASLSASASDLASDASSQQDDIFCGLMSDFLTDRHAVSPACARALCAHLHAAFTSMEERTDTEARSIQACLPLWITERLLASHEPEHVRALGRAFLHPAPLCLRVNTRIITRDRALGILRNEGIVCSAGAYSPHAIIVHERINLSRHELMLSGAVEVQDEGSQIVGFAAHPHATQRVLDACAGAGGKSLHIAVLQDDSGYVMASDLEPKRMRELHGRMKTALLSSIHIQALHLLSDTERQRLMRSFDLVIVDAPCSGLGTIRRSPMLKWRSSADAVLRLQEKQRRIISEYAEYVKPGGTLVYVTCSIMSEENDHVIDHFLQHHPEFCGDSLLPHLEQTGCTLAPDGPHDHLLHLDPLRCGTDGFFIARMRRSA